MNSKNVYCNNCFIVGHNIQQNYCIVHVLHTRYATTDKDAQLLSEYIMSVTFVFILNHVHPHTIQTFADKVTSELTLIPQLY